MTASEIAGRAKMHKTKISRAVHRLTERRMVVRDRDTDDRRVEHLTLTKSGKAAYDDLRSIAKRYEANLVAGMNDSEVDALRRVLMKLGEGRAKSFT
jgi:DNA-binding MarR family transcriptional regulator